MRRLLSVILVGMLGACSTVIHRPCEDGGDPAWDTPNPKVAGGDKQCVQHKDHDGLWQNDGPYREWYPDGHIALKGEYKMGKRNGKWLFWDEKGKKLAERWFDDGVETRTRVGGPKTDTQR